MAISRNTSRNTGINTSGNTIRDTCRIMSRNTSTIMSRSVSRITPYTILCLLATLLTCGRGDVTYSGSVAESDGVSYIASVAGIAVDVDVHTVTTEFSITLPGRKCCPIVYLNHGDAQADALRLRHRKCYGADVIEHNVHFYSALWLLAETAAQGYCTTGGDAVHRAEQGYAASEGDSANITAQGYRASESDTLVCHGRLTRMAGRAATWNITIGYPCDALQLLDFRYRISFRWTRDNDCKKFQRSLPLRNICAKFYDEYALANTVGVSEQELTTYHATVSNTYHTHKLGCYLHYHEYGCHLVYPQCTDGKVRPVCRQMCLDFGNACPTLREKNWGVVCDALPDSLDPEVCFYKEVTCATAALEHAAVLVADGATPVAGTRAPVACAEGYTPDGDASAECLLSGKWNMTGRCTVIRGDLLLSILPHILRASLCIVFICTARWYFRYSFHPPGPARHAYDYVVLYSGENYHGVRRDILEPLEEQHQLKLCIPDRDFHPGKPADMSMGRSLLQSKGALLIVTSNFLRSDRCRLQLATMCTMVTSRRHFVLVLVLAVHWHQLLQYDVLRAYYTCDTCLNANDRRLLHKIQHSIRHKPAILSVEKITSLVTLAGNIHTHGRRLRDGLWHVFMHRNK